MLKLATYELGRPAKFDIDLDGVVDKGYLTHNIHPYPAKFIPQIPRRLIEIFSSPGDVVADPFCGSGTALVEARLLGRTAVGSDLNPLSTLVSRVKATPLDATALGHLDELLKGLAEDKSPLEQRLRKVDRPLPEFRNRDHWFTSQSLLELNYLMARVERIEDIKAREAALVVFSSIVVRASNQDSETRWVARDKGLRAGQVITEFSAKLASAVQRLRDFAAAVDPAEATCIRTADARAFSHERVIDYAVTSPPYLNSFDYYLYHKLRTFWLGFDHKPVQAREIGSRHRHCDLGAETELFVAEMTECISAVSLSLRIGGHLSLVVGDSIVKGALVPMDEIYSSIARTTGLRLVDKFEFDQRRYTRAFHRGFKSPDKKSYILTYEKVR